MFLPALSPGDAAGRFFHEGEIIGYVLPAYAHTVRVVVPQNSIDLVTGDLTGITIEPSWRRGDAIEAHILRAVPAGQFELPSPALSLVDGGAIPTDPRDSKNQTALARVFQFDIDLGAEDAPFGARVQVKFHHTPEPLGWQIYRRMRQLFLATLDV